MTLTTSQIPAHSHVPQCYSISPGGDSNVPKDSVWALSSTGSAYVANTAPTLPMSPDAVGLAGGSQPHDNMIPFLVINFILSLFGVFPSQT